MNPIQSTIISRVNATLNHQPSVPRRSSPSQVKQTRPVASTIASKAKPRPKKPAHRIVHGDCLDMLPKIPDATIDFICADFPYNISGKGGLTMKGNKLVKADFGDWDKFPSEEAYLDFVFKVCAEYRRILKPNASMVLFF